MNTKSNHTSIRLPADLRETLTAVAEREGRSLSSLIVELLQEKVHSLGKVQALAERDPLSAAWYAAEAAELFSRAIRGAIVRYRNQESSGDLGVAEIALEQVAAAPELGNAVEQLTPFQRELLEEFSRLPIEKQKAFRTIIKAG